MKKIIGFFGIVISSLNNVLSVHAEEKPQINMFGFSSSSLELCDTHANVGFYDPSSQNTFNIESKYPGTCKTTILKSEASGDEFLEEIEDISDEIPQLCNVTRVVNSGPYPEIVFQKLFIQYIPSSPDGPSAPPVECHGLTMTAKYPLYSDSPVVLCFDDHYSPPEIKFSNNLDTCKNKKGLDAVILYAVPLIALVYTAYQLYRHSGQVKIFCVNLGERIKNGFWGDRHAGGLNNNNDVRLGVNVALLAPNPGDQVLSPRSAGPGASSNIE